MRTGSWVARREVAPVLVGTAGALGCALLATVNLREAGSSVCPFRALTGRACPGCGLTRGLQELLTGNPVAALRLNLLLAVLVPGALYVYAVWARSRWRERPTPTFTLTHRSLVLGIAALVAFTVVRNLPWEPFLSFSSLQ